MTDLKERPFALIGVNVSGQGVQALKDVMAKENLPWRSFADSGPITRGAIASKWNLSATPTLYVIDHLGVIRYKWVGQPGEKVVDAVLEKLIREAEAVQR